MQRTKVTDMEKVIVLKGRRVTYSLERKKVKNINLRIRADGSVYVSAHKGVPQAVIDGFLISKADFILRAIDTEKKPLVQYFTEDEVRTLIRELCEKIYPYYKARGVGFPRIKFRKMVSRWGVCHTKKCSITFNTALMYAPVECIEYVVAHEFTHFLVPNHSGKFYDELEKICPDYRLRRKTLKEISVR